MIIAVNKCPQNITLKAFNLSPQIYILSLFQFPRKWMGFYVPFSTSVPQLRDINLGPRAPTLVEMGFYVPSLIPDLARADIKPGPRAPTLVYLHARA